jgi:glycosyltransferase involved in cell wall biosynthesis
MTKKRVCIVIPDHWSANMGGAEYQVKVLLGALIQENKYEIFYLTRNASPEYKPEGYSIIKIANDDGWRRFGTFFDAAKLFNLLNKIKPDIIYQRVGCAYTGIVAYYAKNNNCKFIWHISSDRNVKPFDFALTRNLPFRMIEHRVMNYGITQASNIIAQTKQQDALLKKYYGKAASAIIPNFHPKPIEKIIKEKPIKVLFVGKLHPLKQPQIFIDLAHDLRDLPNVKFLLIGPPDHDKARQAKIMNRAGKLSNFDYLGYLTQEQVNEYMAQSHILVNTSLWEGFPNTFIQAWMRKVPVVSLNVNPDGVFDDNRLGLMSDGYDEFNAQVRLLCENDEIRESMGTQAQMHAFNHFSEENAKYIVALFDQ